MHSHGMEIGEKMSERTVLEWEEYVCNRLPAMRTKNGKHWDIYHWDIYVGSGTIDNPTYNLSVGNVFIIQSGITTIEIAFKMAQQLQDVLDDCWGILGIT